MRRDQGIRFLAKEVPDAFRDKSRLRSWLTAVARDHGTRVDGITYVLLSDKGLHHYNVTFLRHDEFTDVITFPAESNNGLAGDVLISLDRVRENARTFGAAPQHELRRVMVHGLLHLCGHGDRTRQQKAAMRALEDRYLERWGA